MVLAKGYKSEKSGMCHLCQFSGSVVKHTGHAKKVIPLEKLDISGIVVNFFVKFTTFSEEDSGHISCKFHCNIWLHSKIITI